MKDKSRVEFGRKVTRLRKQQSLTIEQLAKMADLKPITVQHIEDGTFNVPFDVLNRIAVVLGGELQIVINDLTE
jgi:transcriptional regulator with XRE-family HTH domain